MQTNFDHLLITDSVSDFGETPTISEGERF
jgi:hypothetical protein